MFTNYEFERINHEYKRLVDERQIKAMKIWVPLLLLSIVLVLGVVFLTDWLESQIGSVLIPLYGGMIVVGSIVAVLISKFGTSTKPSFNYLYKEIIEKINLNNGKTIKYYPFQKVENTFVGTGGLFPKSSRVQNYRHSINNYEEMQFDVFDCMLITGSGKNQAVHFNGLYYYFKAKSSALLQVRSNGRPHYKGHKYEKIDSSDIFKVYVEEGKNLPGKARQFIHNMSELKNKLNAKKVYLSVTLDEIHFAYQPMVQIRKQKKLTLSRLNELYKFFLNEENIIKDLLSISNNL